MGAGEGGGGGGGAGGHQDIEEKFKKEISKEMANLKEFLIQQVGDIYKMRIEFYTHPDMIMSKTEKWIPNQQILAKLTFNQSQT